MTSIKQISSQTTKTDYQFITNTNSLIFQWSDSIRCSDFKTYLVLKELLEENIKELKIEVVHIQQINICSEKNLSSIYQLKKSIYKMDVLVLQKYYEMRSQNLIKWQERLFQQYTFKQWW
ncbi:Hypothetical_protein [Hexamita inflata]|uniref:Hypothetical_protein n=1 Tax=Hexamita inflata TaxID=28002 RepID=A0AA86P2D1_9EUKA|nr:Hypothetical protein HINF_LOCUS18912 [Hexamita inflata]